ncbi:hypothetical protein V6N11_067477 [Hibiscus sabdariffa]|uniref:Uncharacterized protein n=1 Tax=Hibiscus sabdariffa TaxID=183260 RepID=A0ABR2SRT5_9ROSI
MKGRNHESGSVAHGSDISMLEIGNNSFDAPVEVSTTTTVNNAMEVGQLSPMNYARQTTRLKLSFRDIMAGEARSPVRSPAIEDLDVEVIDEDVRIISDGVDSHKGANLQSSVLPEGMSGSSLAHDKSIGSMVAETSLQGAQHGSGKGVIQGSRTLSESLVVLEGTKASMKVDASGKVTSVASKDTVVPTTSSLNKENLVAVRVVETTERPHLKEKNGRVLPASIIMTTSKGGGKNVAAMKGIARTSAISKKKMSKPPSQPTLQKLVASLSSELDKAQVVVVHQATNTKNTSVGTDGDV